MTRHGQNVSSAVMQRRVEPPDSLDFFPTPPWATRALVEHVIDGHGWRREQLRAMSCWEPACGEGDMARALAPYFATLHASDVHDYGYGAVADFLFPGKVKRVDWIVTNPPFRLGPDFVIQALSVAEEGVAMLVRTAFLEGAQRWRDLFRPHPPKIVAPFVERVPMFKGRLDPAGSTATSYCWIVWAGRGRPRWSLGTEVVWIPPCRAALERPGDYPAAAAGGPGALL